jgi:hypothetical protein
MAIAGFTMVRTFEQTRALFDRWAATYGCAIKAPAGPLSGYRSSLRQAVFWT